MNEHLDLTDLSRLQTAQGQWVRYNFPDQESHQPLLGLAEEIGELSHAHLKCEQGIRGTKDEHLAKAADAIGDIVIYLASYCNRNGYDLAYCVERAWDTVRVRDWRKYPDTGRPPEPGAEIQNMGDFRTYFGGELDSDDGHPFC